MTSPTSSTPHAAGVLAVGDVAMGKSFAQLPFMGAKPRRLSPDEAEELFAAILEERHRSLLGLAKGITGDYHAAQDIVQEVYLKLYEHLHRKRVDGRLYSWLRTVTMNAAIDYTRMRRRRNLVLTPDPYEPSPRPAATSDAAALLCEQLAQAMKQLPRRRREVFELRVMDDCSFEQIAALLHSSEPACRSAYRRACLTLGNVAKAIMKTDPTATAAGVAEDLLGGK